LRQRLGETEGMLASLRSRNDAQTRELQQLRTASTAAAGSQQQVS
jgi:hypothetical protein